MSIQNTCIRTPLAEIQKRKSKKKAQQTIEPTYHADGLVLPIQASLTQPMYIPILNTIYEQLIAMLSHHCKITVCRFDLTTTPEHKLGDFKLFLRAAIDKLKNKFNLKRVGYVWVREIGSEGTIKKAHYHLMMIVDGNKIQSPHGIHQVLNNEWQNTYQQPHIHIANSHRLTNTHDQYFKDAFLHCSYLAKVHTKDLQPTGYRNYGASQITKAPIKRFAA